MSIYSDLSQIQTVSNTNYSVDELVQQFNAEDLSSNKAQVNQCIICAKIQQKMLDNHNNNTNSKAYKKEAANVLAATKMKKKIFNYNAEIGRWVQQQNDPTIYEMSKRKIKEKMDQQLNKPKQAPRTKKENPEIVALKEQLKQEQENNNTLVEHFTDTINTWETAFITIADYLDDRDIDWQQLLKKRGIVNPLDNH